jgi:hypothetical protein
MVKYIIIILVLLSFQAQGQIIRANPFYTSRTFVAPATDTLLLDSFPAQVAFSFRKIKTSYTGNCIRVRRSDDNTEQDIGFVSNYLDTTSMKTFVGANDGFVTTWYDQGDSAKNGTMTTAANQPRIILSGVIDRRGGEVALIFDGTNDYLLTTNYNFTTKSKIYTSIVSSVTTTNASRLPFALADNSTYRSFTGLYFQSTGRFASQYSRDNTNNAIFRYDTYSANVVYLMESLWDTDNTTINNRIIAYRNNTQLTINAGADSKGNIRANNKPFSIGADGLGNFRLIGSIQEILFYDSDQTSNRSAIADNVNRFYSIY